VHTLATPSTPAPPDIQPFFLRGGPIGCLLIHGFTATPWEMRYLGEYLHAAGLSVSGVRLAGHATSVDDLARSTRHDWLASARAGLTMLHRHAARPVVIGQSMGALLALRLAAEHPDEVAGVGLLATALELADRRLRWLAPLLPLLERRRPYLEKGESDIADPAARAASPSYRRVPVRAVREVLALQREVRPRLPQVRQPTLIVHSRQDHTCPLSNVTILQRRLGGPTQTLMLDDSYHVVSVDVEKERVATAVRDFAARASRAGAAAPQNG